MQIANDVLAAPPLSGQSLADARRAARFVEAHISEWEALPDHKLDAIAPRVEELARLLTMSNRVDAYPGEVERLQKEWASLWEGPAGRIFALRERVRSAVGLTSAQRATDAAIHQVVGIADFEALLGMPRTGDLGESNIQAIGEVWGKKIAAWEKLNPIRLVQHQQTIFRIAGALDSATMFSPVVIDYLNGNAHGQARDWSEKVIVALPLEMYRRFSALAGLVARAAMAQEVIGKANETASRARWSRLEPVMEWAFAQRRADPTGTRAPVIRRIAGQVRAMAKEAGEPLSGDDVAVIRTITGWFREAGIK